MKSWNGSVNAVVPATARSTCSSPSTSRRTLIPPSARLASSMLQLLRFARLWQFEVLVGIEGRGDEGIGSAQVSGRLKRRVDLLGGDAGRGQPLLELGHRQQD